ncbi:hybrid sensor histidine kinase/response regulator [Butyrivibrio sp. CB08]|uniref:hybrid sensor histidine kinase/response regulator n=1 Tax=Butyrivibrio sp. CB08 TaxID=2364879 RepID=UPI000EA91E1C|nr:hybrid sensor histidine kinase/response regulator [Butyrivibrio sp. CB08]RKM61369.1 hybrid sensor histidine kinase/response regulator [Butyrivibrio sp. CB08]
MNRQNKTASEDKRKKNNMIIPLVFVFVFMTVMVVYVSSLMYKVAVSNSYAVMEDRIMTVSSMIDNHLNTAENVLHVAGDSVHHMLVSGTTSARIHEFLVNETTNVSEQFDENYTGLYGYIMGKYIDGLNWVPPEDYDPKSRDWFIVAKKAAGEVAFSPLYVDAQTGNMIISACRMLPDKQSVIALDVQLRGIQSMMKELKVNGKGYGFVIDSDGLIIANEDETKIGTNISETEGGKELLATIREVDSGSFSYKIGKEKSTIHVNSVGSDWYVVMVVSDRELYSEVWSQRIVIIIICVLIFSMISAVYYAGYNNEKKYTTRMEEMKLEEQKSEYDRKVLELEKDAANASNKAKSDFLANMSHEIRTPLNGILGMDEMIIRESRESRIKQYALEIKSAGNTLLSIINDILDMSKIESGNFEIVPIDYEVSSVLNDVLNMTRPRAGKKGLEYVFQVSPDIPSTLNGDEIRIRQVILNIINNAIKYTQEGSVSVVIAAREIESGNFVDLVISVSDTGMGIREEDKDKLFKSFQRLDEKKNRNIEGTGLGLHITHSLLDMMGGRIDIESEYGKGSTFTITVPQQVINKEPIGDFSKAVKNYLDNIGTDEVALYAPEAEVLVVDDNAMNLEVIEGLLADTRMKLELVQSGEECIERASKKKYDCILLDQMMPGMSGEETLIKMKEMDILKGTPVIALTADAIIGAKESYIQKGFTDYISKPVKYALLEQALKDYLPKGKQIVRDKEEGMPVILIWGEDSDKLKAEKEKLTTVYKCVCAVGDKARDKYLEKHEVQAVMHVV